MTIVEFRELEVATEEDGLEDRPPRAADAKAEVASKTHKPKAKKAKSQKSKKAKSAQSKAATEADTGGDTEIDTEAEASEAPEAEAADGTASAADPQTEPAAAEPPPVPPSPLAGGGGGGRPGPLVWIAAAVVVVLLAATGVCAWGWISSSGTAGDLQHQASLRASAAKAASKYVVDLTTYSYKTIGNQQSTLNAESTATFRKTFANSAKTLGPIFTQLQATATGKVVDAAVKAVSESGAVVLVYADQLANSTQLKSPQTQPSRLRVTLVRKDGKWLLDKVDLVS